MQIYGEEYGMMLTVGATTEISEFCPDGDFTRIGELLDMKYVDMINAVSKFIVAMSKGYDDNKRFSGEEVTHKPLTVEMVKSLPATFFKEAQTEAFAAFRDGSKTTVEVAPSKKEGNP